MADRLTTEELTAMRARCEAATAGPWAPAHRTYNAGWRSDGVMAPSHDVLMASNAACAYRASDADTEFIAHARTDLPAALDEIDALTAERDRAVLERNAAFNEVSNQVERGQRLYDEIDALRTERDVAVVHEALLADAARSVIAANELDHGLDETLQALLAVVDAASPAARRYVERRTALEQFWKAYGHYRASVEYAETEGADLVGAQFAIGDDGDALDAAYDALRALDKEAPHGRP